MSYRLSVHCAMWKTNRQQTMRDGQNEKRNRVLDLFIITIKANWKRKPLRIRDTNKMPNKRKLFWRKTQINYNSFSSYSHQDDDDDDNDEMSTTTHCCIRKQSKPYKHHRTIIFALSLPVQFRCFMFWSIISWLRYYIAIAHHTTAYVGLVARARKITCNSN